MRNEAFSSLPPGAMAIRASNVCTPLHVEANQARAFRIRSSRRISYSRRIRLASS